MKVIVLSSGGVDSTTCIAAALEKYGAGNVATVSVFYGQKHRKELECARQAADYYDLPHYELDLSSLLRFSDCALLAGSSQPISHASYEEQLRKSTDGIISTYVPFRNGLMLSACATLAMSLFPGEHCLIGIGAHADDAAGNAYADCSPEFNAAMSEAISLGTYGKVTVWAPFAGLDKAAVVAEGLRLKAPYHLTWSCYEGGEIPCGVCGTCVDRAAAFAANHTKDPALEVDATR